MCVSKKVIKKFGRGGTSLIADELGLNRSTVSRWNGGDIPSKYHKPLLKIAKKNKVKLTASDLVGV